MQRIMQGWVQKKEMMMTDSIFSLLIVGVVCALFSFFVGAGMGTSIKMSEAFERGLAVECLGEKGYHWECEE